MHADVLIIGGGMAGLQLAKKISEDLNVIILTKSKITNSNSYLAQGGIAAAIGTNDNVQKHALDTLEAGRFHNKMDVVTEITAKAPSLIKELIEEGCLFDRNTQGDIKLGMEGAHCEKRIVHSGGDATGKKVVEFLSHSITGNITIIEDVFVYELLLNGKRCIGAKGLDRNGSIFPFLSDNVVLATGGCGQVYQYTSNDSTVTGDGIALAYLAGASLTDMEFIQFHPTMLNVNGKTMGLISEAVRGEGARLVTEDGTFIMERVHPYKDLAPRHIVSQEIFHYLENGDGVYLDISSINDFEDRFPSITVLCKKHGIDLKEKRIPVAPGCHFLMGGIQTDLVGKTSIDGLYAIGESACTGLHGANRLASNSLLEGLYMGDSLAKHLNEKRDHEWKVDIHQEATTGNKVDLPIHLPDIVILQRRMMSLVGIVREENQLLKQLFWLESIGMGTDESIQLDLMREKDIQKYFMYITSWLITKSALERTESRGGHFRLDFPNEEDDWLRKKIIIKKEKDEKNELYKIAKTT